VRPAGGAYLAANDGGRWHGSVICVGLHERDHEASRRRDVDRQDVGQVDREVAQPARRAALCGGDGRVVALPMVSEKNLYYVSHNKKGEPVAGPSIKYSLWQNEDRDQDG
jgi:hypothetical protein